MQSTVVSRREQELVERREMRNTRVRDLWVYENKAGSGNQNITQGEVAGEE